MPEPLFIKKKKKKKPRNVVLDYLGYLALRLLILLLSCFTIDFNLKIAVFLGRLLYKHYHRGRNRALDNLHAAYPNMPESWYHQTARRSFEHIVMLAIDVIFTPRIVKKHNWRQYSRFVNAERPKWMIKEGKGLIMVTGHYANFEIVGYMMGLFGFDIVSVARPLDNPFISKYLYGVRERAGQRILDKKGAAEQMSSILKSGAALAFIADQDAGPKGLFVDFFGRKASTYKSIGLLAITENLPIVVGCSRRVDNKFFFGMLCNRIITPDEWAEKADPLRWVTQEYTKAIEDFVRQDPSQYWWLHRRWKHRPKEERQAGESADGQ
jgi:KDO2-lipid IV(A) lauroyltransferase